MKRTVAGILLSAWAISIVPSTAYAQSTAADIVEFLMTNQAVRTGDFERDQEASENARDTISRALLVNLVSVPIASSSSGFLYRLNPELGTVERATQTFGSFFIERALTPGHGRASVGISAWSSSFEQLDGASLQDGTLLTIANRFRDEASPFDTETLTLRVRSSTMTAYASVGITDRLEIGGALPFVRLTLDGQRVNVYRGRTFLQASGSAAASGIADAAIRAKYTFVARRRGGAAIAAEFRLPTGDVDNLLGAGSASLRLIGIGAYEQGSWMVSGNAGLLRGGISDEYTFGGAAAVAVHPRLTLTSEALARYLVDLRPIELSARPHPTIAGIETVRLIGGDPGRLIAGALTGLKWNPAGKVVIGGSLRWYLTTAGLTAPVTPSLSFEYAF
jgi:hypothetical protein